MPKIIHPAVFVLDRVQRRFARSRPGSVLILTVVLVVLLALLGTALLSTTRTDRYTASWNQANTQIDMLVEGVKEMSKSAIRGGLYGAYNGGTTSFYRPPTDSSYVPPSTVTAQVYRPYDAVSTTNSGTVYDNDAWLSPRLPEVSAAGSAYAVYWPAIGEWLAGSGFDSPFAIDGGSQIGGVDITHKTTYTSRFADNQFHMVPTYISPSGVAGGPFPAWYLAGDPMDPIDKKARFVLAGDADGDGIADSGFFKLPVGEIDGVTYYACVRIIDNNSAVNANTAWSRFADFDASYNPTDATGAVATDYAGNLGWFRSHVGLMELLNRASMWQLAPIPFGAWNSPAIYNARAEMDAISTYRFGGKKANASLSMLDDTTHAARADGTFITLGDALENQLSRRLRNPGYATTNGDKFQSFPITDAMSLAYHFTLLSTPDSPPSATLESKIYNANLSGVRDSLVRSAENFKGSGSLSSGRIAGQYAYDPSRVDWWFDANFNWEAITGGLIRKGTQPFDQSSIPGPGTWNSLSIGTVSVGSGTMSPYRTARSVVTVYNPVSNQIQKRDIPPEVKKPSGGPVANVDYMVDFRANPAKTNVNTAKFDELWRAFWCVMAEDTGATTSSGSPFGADSPAVAADIYRGMDFNQVWPFKPGAGQHPQRMFRSSIRTPVSSGAPAHFAPKMEVLLRAAIAATQAEQLRRLGTVLSAAAAQYPDVVHRIQLPLNNYSGGSNVNVTIFGYNPTQQVYITEIYGQSDYQEHDPNDPSNSVNAGGFVAVELFNPHSCPVTMDANWHIWAVDRATAASYPLSQPALVHTFTTPVTINPGSFIVLDNLNSGAGHVPSSAGTFPPAGPQRIDGIPLEKCWNRELVIVRDVKVPNPAGTTYPCPVDSFDMTGYHLTNPKPANANATAQVFHYVRGADPAATSNARWRCVYPGRYQVFTSAGADLEPRQQGSVDMVGAGTPTQWGAASWDVDDTGHTVRDPWASASANGGPDNDPKVATTWGAANKNGASYPNPVNIQMPDETTSPNTGGWPSPNMLDAGKGQQNKFPFGQFARNGDMLQIPFIGAYTVEDPSKAAGTGFIELNSVSMDAAFAEDTDPNDDEPAPSGTDDGSRPREQIGRLCPVLAVTGVSPVFDDFSTTVANHRYAWAKKLFDYLTVQAPQDDYLPNVAPDRQVTDAGEGTTPQAVDNDDDGTANDGTATGTGTTNSEDTVPVQGLVNIGTAPARVLATLPMVSGKVTGKWTGTSDSGAWSADGSRDANVELAKAIVLWRDGDPQRWHPRERPVHFDIRSLPGAGIQGDAGCDPKDRESDQRGRRLFRPLGRRTTCAMTSRSSTSFSTASATSSPPAPIPSRCTSSSKAGGAWGPPSPSSSCNAGRRSFRIGRR